MDLVNFANIGFEPSLESVLRKLKTRGLGEVESLIPCPTRYLGVYAANPERFSQHELDALTHVSKFKAEAKSLRIVALSSVPMDFKNQDEENALPQWWPRIQLESPSQQRLVFQKLQVLPNATELIIVDLRAMQVVCWNALPEIVLDATLARFPFPNRARIELLSETIVRQVCDDTRLDKYTALVFAGKCALEFRNKFARFVHAWPWRERRVLVAGEDDYSRRLWSSMGGTFGQQNEMLNDAQTPVLALVNFREHLYYNNALVKHVHQVDEIAMRQLFQQRDKCQQRMQCALRCRPGNCPKRCGLIKLSQDAIITRACSVCASPTSAEEEAEPWFGCVQCDYFECAACTTASLGKQQA